MLIELGSPVHCLDGPYGVLGAVVIDPIARRVTHLVVAPKRKHALSRLVPIKLARQHDGQIVLSCTSDEVPRFEPVEESAYLRLGDPRPVGPGFEVGIENILVLPYYYGRGMTPVPNDSPVPVTYHRVPRGEVEIRRASDVLSADEHDLGRVDGFIVDYGGQVTHLVLERGHLFGRREVTIPIDAVERVRTDSISLGLTRDEVSALPALSLRRWHEEQATIGSPQHVA